MNLKSSRSRHNLFRAARTSERVLRPFRENRGELIRSYVGTNYGQTNVKAREKVANYLLLTAEIYTMMLSAERPRCLVTPEKEEQILFSKIFQQIINDTIRDIRLEKTLRSIVLDAIFSVGIAKTYMADSVNEIRIEVDSSMEDMLPGINSSSLEVSLPPGDPYQLYINPGKPFVERISLDDFVFDTQASEWEKIRFAQHKYRVPYYDFKRDLRYDPAVLKRVTPTSKWSEIDASQNRAEDISRELVDHDDVEPMVTVREIWCPSEKQWGVFTDDDSLPPLMVEDWIGSENGPFRLLRFGDVPDNILPTPPASNLASLDKLLNSLLRKSARQARNQKTVTAYSGDVRDAKNVLKAQDGEMVRVSQPDMIREMKYNGVDQVTFLFWQGIGQLYSRMAGNLDAIGGLGPQSQTATQDKLIHGVVSEREARMQYEVQDFVAGIMYDIGYLLWEDEFNTKQMDIKLPGISSAMRTEWSPSEREGDLRDYNLTIEPYSMAFKSPSERAAALNQLVQSVYLPAMPFLAQSGGRLDFEALNDINAELLNLPRLREIIKFDETSGPAPGQPPASAQPISGVRIGSDRVAPGGGAGPDVSGSALAQAMAFARPPG